MSQRQENEMRGMKKMSESLEIPAKELLWMFLLVILMLPCEQYLQVPNVRTTVVTTVVSVIKTCRFGTLMRPLHAGS